MVEATVGLVGSRKWLVGRRCFYFEFILDLHEILLLVIVLSIFLLLFFSARRFEKKKHSVTPKDSPELKFGEFTPFQGPPTPKKKQPNLTNIFGMVWNRQLVLKVPPQKKQQQSHHFFSWGILNLFFASYRKRRCRWSCPGHESNGLPCGWSITLVAQCTTTWGWGR